MRSVHGVRLISPSGVPGCSGCVRCTGCACVAQSRGDRVLWVRVLPSFSPPPPAARRTQCTRCAYGVCSGRGRFSAGGTGTAHLRRPVCEQPSDPFVPGATHMLQRPRTTRCAPPPSLSYASAARWTTGGEPPDQPEGTGRGGVTGTLEHICGALEPLGSRTKARQGAVNVLSQGPTPTRPRPTHPGTAHPQKARTPSTGRAHSGKRRRTPGTDAPKHRRAARRPYGRPVSPAISSSAAAYGSSPPETIRSASAPRC